ncbi:MAG: hypothetical protein WDW36_001668 [Sanguina aurantia]
MPGKSRCDRRDGFAEQTSTPSLEDPTKAAVARPSSRNGGNGVGSGGPVSLESAAFHLLAAGAGCIALTVMRLFNRQSRSLKDACGQLQDAQDALKSKEDQLMMVEQQLAQSSAEVSENGGGGNRRWRVASAQATTTVLSAQQELDLASAKCRVAAGQLETTINALQTTEQELSSSRSTLQTAYEELQCTRARLESSEGELGSSKSQNELMARELDILRRQLKEAGKQLESYVYDSRRKQEDANDWD